MISYNYTSIRETDDSKVYGLKTKKGGEVTKISSSGYEISFLKIFIPLFILMQVIGIILCFITGKFLYWPFNVADGTFNPGFLIIFLALIPIGGSMLLHGIKIQHYRLSEFLYLFFKPKYTITETGKRVKFTKTSIKSIIERV